MACIWRVSRHYQPGDGCNPCHAVCSAPTFTASQREGHPKGPQVESPASTWPGPQQCSGGSGRIGGQMRSWGPTSSWPYARQHHPVTQALLTEKHNLLQKMCFFISINWHLPKKTASPPRIRFVFLTRKCWQAGLWGLKMIWCLIFLG